MNELTPTEIAKQWRVSKTTVYKYLNKGRMSYRTDENGHKLVDVSEVLRVFGEPVETNKPSMSIGLNNELVKELKNRIDSLERKLEKRDDQLDKLLESLNNVTLRLEDHSEDKSEAIIIPPPSPTSTPELMSEEAITQKPNPEQPKKKRGLFTRLIAAAIDD